MGVNYLGNIQNCYNTGTISAEINHAIGTYGGGIAGQSSAGRISNCYNVGMSARGILSDNFLTPTYVIDCYYLTSASDQGVGRSEPDYERIFAFSEEELRQQSTFSAFDFDQIWVMTENGPQLQ